MLLKVRRRDHYGDRTVLFLDCGDNHMTLHMGYNCMEINKHSRMEIK